MFLRLSVCQQVTQESWFSEGAGWEGWPAQSPATGQLRRRGCWSICLTLGKGDTDKKIWLKPTIVAANPDLLFCWRWLWLAQSDSRWAMGTSPPLGATQSGKNRDWRVAISWWPWSAVLVVLVTLAMRSPWNLRSSLSATSPQGKGRGLHVSTVNCAAQKPLERCNCEYFHWSLHFYYYSHVAYFTISSYLFHISTVSPLFTF